MVEFNDIRCLEFKKGDKECEVIEIREWVIVD